MSSDICANKASNCREPLPNVPTGTLIGKVGNAVFSVGTGATVTASDSGTLYLRMNEIDGGFDDNDGTLTVRVSTATSGTGSITPPPPTYGRTVLGGLDIVRYCVQHGYPGGAEAPDTTMWSWRCVYTPGLTQLIGQDFSSFNAICVWQYSRRDAIAVPDGAYSRYGLQCQAPSTTVTVSDNPYVQFYVNKMLGQYINALGDWSNLTPSEQQWLFESMKSIKSCAGTLYGDDPSPQEIYGCYKDSAAIFGVLFHPVKAD